MRLFNGLFWLTIISGLVLTLLGIYMQYFSISSTGSYAGRYGDISTGTITGSTVIYLGILLLIFSIWTYKWKREEKEKFNKME